MSTHFVYSTILGRGEGFSWFNAVVIEGILCLLGFCLFICFFLVKGQCFPELGFYGGHKFLQLQDHRHPRNSRPVSLTSVPGKVREEVILKAITQHMRDNGGIRPSQHGFMKGKSCLTNLISFYDRVTRLVDEGKAVDIVYLDFSKAFNTVCHNILLEKLAAHGLDRYTLSWVKNWLNGRAQTE